MPLLEQLGEVHTAPFAALFQAYCATALTHIAEDIRVDALSMLTLWTRRFPDQMFRFRDKVWTWE